MSGTWLVVAPLRAELPRGLARTGDASFTLEALGRTGRTGSPRRFESMLVAPGGAPRASALIITGTCGALAPGAAVGSLVAPSRLVGFDAGRRVLLEPDGALHRRILDAARAEGIAVATDPLVESPEIVDSLDARRSLSASEGAAFVDMESVGLALAARQAGLPWVVLRIVSDSPERSIGWLSELVGPRLEEQPSLPALLGGLARRPWLLPRLAALGLAVHAGRGAVGRLLAAGSRLDG